MANLSGRFPDKMTLEQGYYVVNASTMSLIAGPFVDTSAAYTAWQAARDRTLGTTFIIVWVPHSDFGWGDRKVKTVTQKVTENEAFVKGRVFRTFKPIPYGEPGFPGTHNVSTNPEPRAARTVAEMIDDLHATFGTTLHDPL